MLFHHLEPLFLLSFISMRSFVPPSTNIHKQAFYWLWCKNCILMWFLWPSVRLNLFLHFFLFFVSMYISCTRHYRVSVFLSVACLIPLRLTKNDFFHALIRLHSLKLLLLFALFLSTVNSNPGASHHSVKGNRSFHFGDALWIKRNHKVAHYIVIICDNRLLKFVSAGKVYYILWQSC